MGVEWSAASAICCCVDATRGLCRTLDKYDPPPNQGEEQPTTNNNADSSAKQTEAGTTKNLAINGGAISAPVLKDANVKGNLNVKAAVKPTDELDKGKYNNTLAAAQVGAAVFKGYNNVATGGGVISAPQITGCTIDGDLTIG